MIVSYLKFLGGFYSILKTFVILSDQRESKVLLLIAFYSLLKTFVILSDRRESKDLLLIALYSYLIHS